MNFDHKCCKEECLKDAYKKGRKEGIEYVIQKFLSGLGKIGFTDEQISIITDYVKEKNQPAVYMKEKSH